MALALPSRSWIMRCTRQFKEESEEWHECGQCPGWQAGHSGYGIAAWVRLADRAELLGTHSVLQPHTRPLSNPLPHRGWRTWGRNWWARSWKGISVGKRCSGRERGPEEAQPSPEGGDADWNPGEGPGALSSLTKLKRALMTASELELYSW